MPVQLLSGQFFVFEILIYLIVGFSCKLEAYSADFFTILRFFARKGPGRVSAEIHIESSVQRLE